MEDGDTLIYLGVTPGYLYPVTEAEAGINAIATYLKVTTKQITLDLSYYDGHFTNYDRVNRKGYFENCTSIKKVIIGRGYETYSSDTGTHGDGSITFSAFSGCTKLSEVVFKAGASDGIVTIENYVFRGCAITTMTIPASVNSIYSGALACNTLESVTFANTTGWEIDGAAIDVSDAATNATKLKAGGAWSNKTLFRSN